MAAPRLALEGPDSLGRRHIRHRHTDDLAPRRLQTVSTVSEKLFRKKIPMKYEAAINMVFLFLLMGLMLFVTFNDVMKVSEAPFPASRH